MEMDDFEQRLANGYGVKMEPKVEGCPMINQFVWSHQENYVFWPGMLLEAAEWDYKWRNLRTSKVKSPYILFHFGIKKVSYVTLSQLYDFCEEFKQFYSPLTKSELYISAVRETVEIVMMLNNIESNDYLKWAEENIISFKGTLIPHLEITKCMEKSRFFATYERISTPLYKSEQKEESDISTVVAVTQLHLDSKLYKKNKPSVKKVYFSSHVDESIKSSDHDCMKQDQPNRKTSRKNKSVKKLVKNVLEFAHSEFTEIGETKHSLKSTFGQLNKNGSRKRPLEKANFPVCEPKKKSMKIVKKNQLDFKPFQLIWAKYGKYPVWPGILLRRDIWSSHWKSLRKNVSRKKVLIFWLGTGDVAYVDKSDVFEYCGHYDDFNVVNKKPFLYQLAVAQANSKIPMAEEQASSKQQHVVMIVKGYNFDERSFTSIGEHVKKFVNVVIAGDDSMVALMNVVRTFRINAKSYKNLISQEVSIPLNNQIIFDSVQCCFCFHDIDHETLIEHIMSKHFGWRFQCTKCKFNFKSKSACYIHLLECAALYDAVSCSWAYIRFPKKVDATWSEFIRLQSQKSKLVNACQQNFCLENAGEENTGSKQEYSTATLCSACNGCFGWSDELAAHMLNSFDCLNSAKVFINELDLKK